MTGVRGKVRAGFTLIELLLALAIFSTLLVLLLASFRGTERTREILSGRYASYRQIRIALDRAGTDMEGAFAAAGVEQTALSCREDDFSGKKASTLIFTAFSLPDASETRPSAGIVKVKYFPRLSADGHAIELFREQSDLPLIDNKIPTRESKIAGGLQDFRVELFDGSKWVAEWPPSADRKSAVPRKAAFILTDAEGKVFRRVVPLPLAGREAIVLNSGKRPRTSP